MMTYLAHVSRLWAKDLPTCPKPSTLPWGSNFIETYFGQFTNNAYNGQYGSLGLLLILKILHDLLILKYPEPQGLYGKVGST